MEELENSNFSEINKYEKMKNYLEQNKILNKNNEITYSLLSDFNLSQLIHTQTIFPLFTSSSSIDSILDIGKSDYLNDIFIYYYSTPKALYPVLYTQIINLCGSDEYSSEHYLFLNKKCIIFTNNNFIHPKILIEKFINPLCKKLKLLKEINRFSKHLLNNIFIITYSNYLELIIKINDLPNILRDKIPDTALVIIDGLNYINFQKVDLEFSKDNSKERKFEFQFKKGKNKNNYSSGKKNELNNFLFGNENEDEICKLILSSISNIYSLYNFNLIFTCCNIEQYSFYQTISSGKIFTYDIKNLIYKKFEKYKCSFNFKLPSKNLDNHKIIFIEPILECTNDERDIFGIISKGEKTDFSFRAYLKEEKSLKMKEIYKIEIDYERKNNSNEKNNEINDENIN